MNAKLEGLARLLKTKVEKVSDEAKYKSYVGDDKILLNVTKKGVKVSISEKAKRPKRRVSPLTEEEKKNIREVKKALKGSLDLMNLVILLIRVKEEANKLNFKALPQDKKDIVQKAVFGIRDAGLFQKVLEDKR